LSLLPSAIKAIFSKAFGWYSIYAIIIALRAAGISFNNPNSIIMSTHKGKPSGINKSEGTGTPSDFKPADLEKDEEIRDQHMNVDGNDNEDVKVKHPNRNVDKPDATNAGGYKQ
jgi:hypothetical protein